MGKMAVNKTARTRRTLTHIPTPLPLDLSQNSSSSIVFYDQSQNGYSQASAASPDKQHNQVVQVAKPGDVVSKARYSSVSKARQDARVHIFTAALLEHICALYEPNPDKQRKVLQVLKYGFDSDDSLFILLTLAADLPKIYFVELCAKLTERDMLSPIAFLDIFSLWRTKYQIGFSELMKSTVKLVDMEPNQQALTPLLPAYSNAQLALLTKPVIGLLMRSPSDPRSSFFSSRYSNDFNEIKAIGSGGFGAVFKVKNKLDEVMYAIKKVRLKHLNHERCRKLLREVKVLATLNHPSIVRYNAAWLEQEAQPRITEVSTSPESSSSEDSISHNGATTADPFEDQRVMLYIQMELCHSNLHDWLFKRNKNLYLKHSDHETACGHIHESKNMHFTRQLLSGLDYIHTHGIIHRDIKTRNIFIGSHGALKIGDFGLARDVVASPSPTRAATSPSWDFSGKREMSDRLSKGIGTSVYSSPEQQNMRVYDSKTDMYSAGIIVFEMYCPFSTEMERYDRIKDLRRDRCIPATLLKRWPDQMSMLNMMVDSNPDKRPSAKDLLSSDLYLDKDQVISHLETRVEELETRNDLLKREMLALKETLKIEANDYVEFQKWRESVKESTI